MFSSCVGVYCSLNVVLLNGVLVLFIACICFKMDTVMLNVILNKVSLEPSFFLLSINQLVFFTYIQNNFFCFTRLRVFDPDRQVYLLVVASIPNKHPFCLDESDTLQSLLITLDSPRVHSLTTNFSFLRNTHSTVQI